MGKDSQSKSVMSSGLPVPREAERFERKYGVRFYTDSHLVQCLFCAPLLNLSALLSRTWMGRSLALAQSTFVYQRLGWGGVYPSRTMPARHRDRRGSGSPRCQFFRPPFLLLRSRPVNPHSTASAHIKKFITGSTRRFAHLGGAAIACELIEYGRGACIGTTRKATSAPPFGGHRLRSGALVKKVASSAQARHILGHLVYNLAAS